MYGKHYATMYCGSMVGAGFGSFAVMGFVIANMKPDRVVGFQVELNVKLLAATFGEPEEAIQKSINYLCAPDPGSRTEGEEGRRLVKVGTFAYRVVNGVTYDKIRNEDERREQHRQSQIRHRQKKKLPKKGTPLADERVMVKAFEAGVVDKDFVPVAPVPAEVSAEAAAELRKGMAADEVATQRAEWNEPVDSTAPAAVV